MPSSRFVDTSAASDDKKLGPVYGYQSQPLVSLEEALEPIQSQIDALAEYIEVAKGHCHYPNEHSLTNDESAAIFLYTMDWDEQSLYRVLNTALRSADRRSLKPWFKFLKLFNTALGKLPVVKQNVWRGISGLLANDCKKGEELIWWGMTSCSIEVDVIKEFMGMKGTVFLIEALNARNVIGYTNFPDEHEVILPMGTRFHIVSNSMDFVGGLCIVHLRETMEKKSLGATSSLPSPSTSNVIHLNVNGELVKTSRDVLLLIEGSVLSDLFAKENINRLKKDDSGNIPLDYDPKLFKHLLNQLQSWLSDPNETRIFTLPSGLEDAFIQLVRHLKFPEQMINVKRNSNKTSNVGSDETDESFEEKIGTSIEILDKGRTGSNVGAFSFNRPARSGCLLGSRRYETGISRIRIKYEYGTVFIGLLSSSIQPRDPIFGMDSSRFYYTPSAYGIDSDGYVTLNGQIIQKTWTTVENNDVFELIIDCQQRRLCVRNERTNDQREIHIDLDTAPLPWRLFVILPYSLWLGSRVSLV